MIVGPGPLINVPAPPVTGTVDGPGSYVPPFGSGIFADRAEATDGTEGVQEGEAAGTPQLKDFFENGRVPTASELEEFAESRPAELQSRAGLSRCRHVMTRGREPRTTNGRSSSERSSL